MKRILSVALTVVLLGVFGVFALGSGEAEDGNQGTGSVNIEADATVNEQEKETVNNVTEDNNKLGKYSVEIKSCRIATDWEENPVVIVTYGYTNNSDKTPTSFMIAFEDSVYQNGIGLNEAYVLSDEANYNSDNQMKEIKMGASLDVEVAYELNDTTTDIEVEVSGLFSFDDRMVTKTFTIVQ